MNLSDLFPGQQSPLTELSASGQQLTNHQRIKDREMQRAFDEGLDISFLPTTSRLKRWGYSRGTWIRQEQARIAAAAGLTPEQHKEFTQIEGAVSNG